MTHECCAEATGLLVFTGKRWVVDFTHHYAPVAFCPWCGGKLPIRERSYDPSPPPTMTEIREWRDGFPVGSFARQAIDLLVERWARSATK